MTDREWWDSLPPDAEFLTPPGFAWAHAARCRPSAPEDDDPPAPGPDHGFVEVWAWGGAWVPLAEFRTWERYDP